MYINNPQVLFRRIVVCFYYSFAIFWDGSICGHCHCQRVSTILTIGVRNNMQGVFAYLKMEISVRRLI